MHLMHTESKYCQILQSVDLTCSEHVPYMDMIGTFPIHVLLDHRWASSANEQCFIYLVAQHRGMFCEIN